MHGQRSHLHRVLITPLRGAALGLLLGFTACSGSGSGEPVAVASFEVDTTHAPIGSLIEATFTFSVLPNAVFDEDYRVFLHVLNDAGELMWTDDHFPPRPTTQWEPGDTIEYTRTILVPVHPYLGDVDVNMGLYSAEDGTRRPLDGEHIGQLAYRVGGLRLLPPAENIELSYTSGWYPVEMDPSGGQSRWSDKVGAILFQNPRTDSLLYLSLGGFESWNDEPRTLTISVGGRLVDRVEIVPSEDVLHRIPLSASLLGDASEIELRLEVDRVFVPAEQPDSKTADDRALGVLVLGAYVEPK